MPFYEYQIIFKKLYSKELINAIYGQLKCPLKLLNEVALLCSCISEDLESYKKTY